MFPITLENITKTYDKGKTNAIEGVSLQVADGELFGLIGPDGAGKSTIFRILTTLLLPDGGKATVCGNDVVTNYKTIRGIVGYMPGRFSLYQDLTVEENLNFFAALFNTSIEQNYELVKEIYVQLEPFKNRRAGKLSGGMKQKLALCCALIHKPEVLFLDEPTTGVDAVSRYEFWDMLKRLRKQGITILVSTAYMDEVANCDKVALMNLGKILTTDSPQGIINAFPEFLFKVRSDKKHKLLKDLLAFGDAFNCYPSGEYIHISFKKGEKTETQIMQELKDHLAAENNTNLEVSPAQPNIEDCFLSLIKH